MTETVWDPDEILPPVDPPGTRPAPPSVPVEPTQPVRRYPGGYPSLALYHALCAKGQEPPANSPLARAACREANAQDLDRDAARATTLEARATVQAAADDELARARTILADAARRHVKGTEPDPAGRRDA